MSKEKIENIEKDDDIYPQGEGACKRTIRKWFKRFKEEGLIKNTRLSFWELVALK